MPLNKKNIKVLILICGIIGFFSYELDELYCADHKYSRQSKYFQLDSLNLNVKVEMLKMPKVKIFFSRDDKFSNDYIITSCNDYEGPVIYIRNDTIMFRDPDNTGKISTEKFTIIRFDDELKLTPKRNALWQGLDKVIRDYLTGVTLADLIQSRQDGGSYVI